MVTAVKILLFTMTIIFLFGAIGEKDNKWKTNYFFGAIIESILLVMTVKYL